MKAGIYRTPNGNLVYVAKDRTIKAASLSPSTWPGLKVSHRSKDDTVEFCGYRATRWADVPNGCTNPQKALDDAMAAHAAEVEKTFGTEGCAKVKAAIDEMQRAEEAFAGSARAAWPLRNGDLDLADGWRVCHKQAAKKHRKQGRPVIGLGDGTFAWLPDDGLYPWQQGIVVGGFIEIVPGAGKSGTL